jgi:orotate phosphoribosyltransferase
VTSLDELHELKAAIERHCITRFDEPVRLASGRMGSYYCDSKYVTLHPHYARLIGRFMAPIVLDSGAEAVGGLAAGCIPIADAVAQAALDAGPVLPTFFGRAEAKDHGPEARAKMSAAAMDDGSPLIRPGRKVAVVEDAVTTGGSSLKAVDTVAAADCDVVLMLTLVERHEGGGARFRERGIPFRRLFYTLEDGSLHIDEQLAESLRQGAAAGG